METSPKREHNNQENIELKIIPQIDNKTGVSCDYINAFAALSTYCLDFKDKQPLINFIKKRNFKLKKYEEYFSPESYKDIITDKNKEAILEIDKLVEEVNIKISNQNIENLDVNQLHIILKRLENLIRN